MWAVLAAIPYTTFPDLPFGLRTFGLMVALGVLVGARLGSDYGERFGINREDTYRTGTLMVLAGIIGSRLTYVATHTEDVDNLVDVIAIWRGGIQFSGGFIAALLVGFPMFRKWTKVQRWHVLNGYAYGLVAGVAIGRIGCYAVGEHFGRTTDFFLGTRYDGGDVREESLGDIPLTDGIVFHNTALYEFLTLALLFFVMTAVIWRARRVGHEVLPVTLVALFMVFVGVERFLLDTLRVNDERVASMTGAQWMSLAMVPYGFWLYFRTRPEIAKLVGPDGRVLEADASLLAETEDESDEAVETAPDELAPPDDTDESAAEAAPATARATSSETTDDGDPAGGGASGADADAVGETADDGDPAGGGASGADADAVGGAADVAGAGVGSGSVEGGAAGGGDADGGGPEAADVARAVAGAGSTDGGDADAGVGADDDGGAAEDGLAGLKADPEASGGEDTGHGDDVETDPVEDAESAAGSDSPDIGNGDARESARERAEAD